MMIQKSSSDESDSESDKDSDKSNLLKDKKYFNNNKNLIVC